VQIVDRERTTPYQEVGYAAFRVVGFSQVPCFLQANESASLLFLFGSSLALARSRRRGARRQHRRGRLLVLSRTPPRHNHRCKSPRDQPSHRRSATIVTGANGIYFVAALPPGPYTLNVSKDGFKSLTVANLQSSSRKLQPSTLVWRSAP